MWTNNGAGSAWGSGLLSPGDDGMPSNENNAAACNMQQTSKRRRRRNRKKKKKVSTNVKMAAVSTGTNAPSGLALKDINAGTAKRGDDDKNETAAAAAADGTSLLETTKPSPYPAALVPTTSSTLRQDLYIHPTTEKYLSTTKHRPAGDANHDFPSLDRLVEQADRIERELVDEIRSIQTTLGVHEGQIASPLRATNGSGDQTDLPSSFECDRDAASLVSEIPFVMQSTPVRVWTTVTGRVIVVSPEEKDAWDNILDGRPNAAAKSTDRKRPHNDNGGRTTTYLALAAALYLTIAISWGFMLHEPKQAAVVDTRGTAEHEVASKEVEQSLKPLHASLDRAARFVERKGFDSLVSNKSPPADSSDNAEARVGTAPGLEKEQSKGREDTWAIDKWGLDFLDKPSAVDLYQEGMDFLHEDDSVQPPHDVVQWVEARQSGSACFQPLGVLSPKFEVAVVRSGCAVNLTNVLQKYDYEVNVDTESPSKAGKNISLRFPYRPDSGSLRPSFFSSDSSTIITEEKFCEPSPSDTFDGLRLLWDASIYAMAMRSVASYAVKKETDRMLRSLAATHVREQLSYFSKQPQWAKIELSVPSLMLRDEEHQKVDT